MMAEMMRREAVSCETRPTTVTDSALAEGLTRLTHPAASSSGPRAEMRADNHSKSQNPQSKKKVSSICSSLIA